MKEEHNLNPRPFRASAERTWKESGENENA